MYVYAVTSRDDADLKVLELFNQICFIFTAILCVKLRQKFA